jgi:DNA-binding GntR family transcriptional regulator
LIKPIDSVDVEEIFFMRQLLENAAAEAAAPLITPQELEELASLQAPQTLIMTLDYDRYAGTFHSIVASASRNQRLEEAIVRIYNDVRRLLYAGIGQPRPDIITQEHDEIIEALRRHDREAAGTAMSDHIANIRRRALQA